MIPMISAQKKQYFCRSSQDTYKDSHAVFALTVIESLPLPSATKNERPIPTKYLEGCDHHQEKQGKKEKGIVLEQDKDSFQLWKLQTSAKNNQMTAVAAILYLQNETLDIVFARSHLLSRRNRALQPQASTRMNLEKKLKLANVQLKPVLFIHFI